MAKTINQIITETTNKLLTESNNSEQAAQAESWWLLEKVTKKRQAELIREEKATLTHEQEKALELYITQRTKENKPLQYILGTVPFCGLEILVEPPTLIPRPETEEWCDRLIQKLDPVKEERLTILDIGVGSGCIALALAKAFPYATVIGVDAHSHAIRLSEKNKTHNKIPNALFIKSDLYRELGQYKGIIDLIVSNPPYISEKEFLGLSKEVTDWEDKSALVTYDEGLAIHKKIVSEAKCYLKKESVLTKNKLPQLLLEFGKGQETNLLEMVSQAGFTNITIENDMEKVPRWITATNFVYPETERKN
ncbi:peptide chain release factor N(5)-glutamine methyltransferase [Candidatus Dependentiae bacterium]|nr:peptide chain release factor N(5)-glutamine methyltransferase [Candidatus Dependentiae bacterium]